jgi:4-carboxymuconolactone decarboxylase
MRLRFLFVGVLALAAGATAQAPAPADLHLRGDRFKPLTAGELTPEQKTLVEHLLSGERGTLNGPFNVLLRSPEMGDRAQMLGAYIRFHTTVPTKLNEFAILITARALNVQYEWAAHHKNALQVVNTKQVSNSAFRAAVDRFGERTVVDLIGTIGYYHFVSMLLNVDRYPMPEGTPPELKPLH